MAIIFFQNIPAARHYYYTAYLSQAYNSGFNYYSNYYGYTPSHYVRKRIDFLLPQRQGFNPLKIGNKSATTRKSIVRVANTWELQEKHTGVEPPFVGSRARDWWYANCPEYELSYYRWFTQQSLWWIKYFTKPPWGINPYIWIADQLNHRILLKNVNTFENIAKVGSQGSGDDQFDNPTSIITDRYYIYVSDSGNKRIVIRSKYTLGYISQITSFGSPPNNFINISDIAQDDNYLYIADKGYPYIIILKKSDGSLYKTFPLRVRANETTAAPISVKVNYYHIYVLDSANLRMKIYTRDTLQKVFHTWSEYDDTVKLNDPKFLALSTFWVFIADSGNNRVLQLSNYYPSIWETIGPGMSVDVDLDHPYGVTISGDYLFITDTFNHRLARLEINGTLFDQYYGSQGSGDDQFDLPANLDAEPQHYFTPY